MPMSIRVRGHVHERRLLTNNALLLKAFAARLFPFSFALLYAFFLANLPLLGFVDRINYLEYAQYSELILASYAMGGQFSLLANEPLWLLANVGLATFLTSEYVLRAVIGVPAFVVSYTVLRKNPLHAGWLVFILFSPQIIKNHIIHLRQGVAISVFLLGYYSERKWMRYPLILMTGLIHSSFFVINSIGVASWISGKSRLSAALRIALLLSVFVVIGAMIDVLAKGMGARQGTQYAEASLAVSGLGFLVWGIVFLLMISSKKDFLVANIFPLAILAFYLAAYFVSPVSGRIFESGLLLVLLACLSLSGWRRQVFLVIFVSHALFFYVTNFARPAFGWGI